MMLGDKAVSAIYRLFNSNIKKLDIEKGHIYKYERPEKHTGEYIAINHLPFVNIGIIQEGVVNVNVHIPRTENNLPNTKRLGVLCQNIIDLLPQETYMNGAYFSLYSDSRPTADNDNTYYINLKFNVKYNNYQE